MIMPHRIIIKMKERNIQNKRKTHREKQVSKQIIILRKKWKSCWKIKRKCKREYKWTSERISKRTNALPNIFLNHLNNEPLGRDIGTVGFDGVNLRKFLWNNFILINNRFMITVIFYFQYKIFYFCLLLKKFIV